jgi:precorrin-2 dehydrogenase/sirohydrochlorin ferrochelatase
MFPLFLDLRDRLAVVVGGGAVGPRKARALLEAGAKVRLVCLESRPADHNHPQLDWRQEPYRPEHLSSACLVCAAASSAVNRQVVADARRLKIWVNVADDPAAGDFFFPAVLRRGEFVIAVGTGGASPGLAQAVRDWLEGEIAEAFEKWVALLAELRPLVLERIKEEERRQVLFGQLRGPHWLNRLRKERMEQVREAMLREIQTAESLHPWAGSRLQ